MSAKNGNGKSSSTDKPAHACKAKWLLKSNDEIPPVAFAVPLVESDRLPLTAAAEREDGEDFNAEDFARTHGEHALKARYASKSTEFRADAESHRERLARLKEERASLLAERKRHQTNLIKVKKALQLPSGTLLVWMTVASIVVVLLMAVEWLNAAGFAAEGEMQSWWRALAFTLGMAVGPVAMELAPSRTLRTAIGIAGVVFIFAYSFSYVPADPSAASSSDEVLRRAATNQNAQSEPVWKHLFDSRLRLAWQYLFSALVTFGLCSWIASHVTITMKEEHKPNPVYGALTRQVESVEEAIAKVRLKEAKSEGDQEEAASSLWLCQEERVAIVRAARYRNQESKEVLRYLTDRLGRWDAFTNNHNP